MDEKILIKSERDKRVKNILEKGPLVLFGIAVLMAILLALPHKEEYTSYSRYSGWSTRTREYLGWEHLFYFGDDTIYFIMFLLASLALLGAIVLGIMYLVNRKCELIITENNVKGKTLFGKEVVLPLYMVSAYSTRKFLSVVSVATASGITKFSLIENYKEIGEVLAQQINQRQRNTENNSNKSADSSSMDDLLKLKSLLDSGIITQEEFDAKKKSLLGL